MKVEQTVAGQPLSRHPTWSSRCVRAPTRIL